MKKILALLFVVILAFYFFTKEQGNNDILHITNDTVILAFGDSLTFGYGAKREESYPSILANLIGVKEVINSGISGEVSSEGLIRLPSVLKEFKPQIVILCHGGNDILDKKESAFIKQNLSHMIEMIQQNKAQVILLGVPTFSGFSINTALFYDELADEYNLLYDGEIITQVLKNTNLKSDQIHPNKEGYKMIAQSIARFLKKS